MATLGGLNLSLSLRATPSKTIVSGRQSGNGPALNMSPSWTLTNGTGADAVNTAYAYANAALAYNGSDDLDLYNGLSDAFGDAITQVTVKGLVVLNTGLYASIRIGAAAGTPWYPWLSGSGDYVILPPSTATNPSMFLIAVPTAAGLAVTNGVADLLRIAHHNDSSEDASYEVALLGATA